MKKFISLVVCIAMLLSSLGVMAKEGELIVNTVKVNVNEGSVTLNDELITVTGMPYVNEQGDTMIDMYALVNALGGEISESDGVYTVTYDGVEIKYTLNSAEVNVSGQTLMMNSAVVIADNGTVMAPLRFVSEALGADVTYNGETGEIVIVSAGGLDEAVNYKLLLKYMEKDKIGHSKEHWRFTKTDNFDMSDNTYGRYYQFAMGDIMFTIKSQKNNGSNSLEQYYLQMQERGSSYYSRYVMYEKGKGEHNGVPYVYAKHRNLDTVFEAYAYETDEYFYFIDLHRTFENFESAKENPDVTAFLNSLEFDYEGGDEENTVDIAEIGLNKKPEQEEKTEYVDGNYRWSIKLYDTWTVNEYYGFYNKVTISRPTNFEEDYEDDLYFYYGGYSDAKSSMITITTYSNPQKQSVDEWANNEREFYKNTVNSEECQISEIQETQIGQLKAKGFEINYSEGEDNYVVKEYYMNYGDFRYEITLTYDKKEEDAEGFTESADAVIKSFVPGEIDVNELGDALEADNDIESLSVLTEFEGDIFKIAYPCMWHITESDTGLHLSKTDAHYDAKSYGLLSAILPQFSLVLSAGSDDLSLHTDKISLSYYDNELNKAVYTLEEYMYKNLAGIMNISNSYLNVSMPGEIKETTLMGKKGYKADLVFSSEDGKTYYTIYYIPYDKENVVTVTKMCEGNVKNTIYETALDKALNSLKFS